MLDDLRATVLDQDGHIDRLRLENDLKLTTRHGNPHFGAFQDVGTELHDHLALSLEKPGRDEQRIGDGLGRLHEHLGGREHRARRLCADDIDRRDGNGRLGRLRGDRRLDNGNERRGLKHWRLVLGSRDLGLDLELIGDLDLGLIDDIDSIDTLIDLIEPIDPIEPTRGPNRGLISDLSLANDHGRDLGPHDLGLSDLVGAGGRDRARPSQILERGLNLGLVGDPNLGLNLELISDTNFGLDATIDNIDSIDSLIDPIEPIEPNLGPNRGLISDLSLTPIDNIDSIDSEPINTTILSTLKKPFLSLICIPRPKSSNIDLTAILI